MPKLTALILPVILIASSLAADETEKVTEEKAAGETADRILFTVTGIKNDKGALRCGLFSEDGWLETSIQQAVAEIKDAQAVCEWQDVPTGTYGISSYHDKNDNGRMDRRAMGIPKEDYAASNNARGSFGPPKFEDASFVYEGGLLELSAEIR